MRCTIFKQVSRFCRKLFQPEVRQEKTKQTNIQSSANLTIVSRDQHNISRQAISDNALKVLHRLNKQGYEAYLVGGCVRDLLLGKTPKDFDVTTNATPEQVQQAFRNCRLVGRRFRLAHIMFGKEIIEVATFRGEHSDDNEQDQHTSKQSQAGMLLRDNVYGTIEQDAIRRDFTINSLYYSVKDFSVRDYCNGLDDLRKGIIRLIGEPETRYREDPVRMLRAIRFAAKLNMTIEKNTAAPISRLAPLLKNIPAPRLFDESLKLLQSGQGYPTYQLLREYGIFGQIFPLINSLFTPQQPVNKPMSNMEKIIEQVLKNTDYRIANNQRVNPAFMFATFLWYPLSELTQKFVQESGLPYHEAFSLASSDILNEQCRIISIPRRLTIIMNDIWRLQLRLPKRFGKRAYAAFEHPKFRAGYDLLELRSSIEKGELLELTKWWDEFQNVSADKRDLMIKQLGKEPGRRKYAPRKTSRKPSQEPKND